MYLYNSMVRVCLTYILYRHGRLCVNNTMFNNIVTVRGTIVEMALRTSSPDLAL